MKDTGSSFRSILHLALCTSILTAFAFAAGASAQTNQPRKIKLVSTAVGEETATVDLWRNSQPGPSIRKFLHLKAQKLDCHGALSGPESDQSYALYLKSSTSPDWLRVYNFNTDCQNKNHSAWTFLPIVDGDDEFWFTVEKVEAEIRTETDDGQRSATAILRGTDP